MQPRDKFFTALVEIRSASNGAKVRPGNVEIVSVGDRLDANAIEALRSALMSCAQRGSWCYVLDLTRVKSLDSPGLGVFISVLRSIRDLGGLVGLVTDTPRLKHILELSARDRNCKIYRRKRDAVKALSAATRPSTAA